MNLIYLGVIQKRVVVFTNKYAQNLLLKFPEFADSKTLKETVELYSDGGVKVNIYTIFTGLTHYVIDELIGCNQLISQSELDIYRYVEEIRCSYSDENGDTDEFHIDNAACTCFLENLVNHASAGSIEYSRFIPYIGDKSKEYCRAWDEFTGVKSPGLWEDGLVESCHRFTKSKRINIEKLWLARPIARLTNHFFGLWWITAFLQFVIRIVLRYSKKLNWQITKS